MATVDELQQQQKNTAAAAADLTTPIQLQFGGPLQLDTAALPIAALSSTSHVSYFIRPCIAHSYVIQLQQNIQYMCRERENVCTVVKRQERALF